MAKKIFIAQSVEELKFILGEISYPVFCLPMNIQTQVYCMKNNIDFYNPHNFIEKNFYENALLESQNLTNKLDFGNLKYDSIKKVYTAIIRYSFHAIIFLEELLSKINAKEKIDEIIISGWSNYTDKLSGGKYLVSDIIENLITDIKISKLSNNNSENSYSGNEKKYKINYKNLNKKRNYILLNRLGYNLIRIIFWFPKKKYYILIPNFDKFLDGDRISYLKKKILRFFKVIFLEFDELPNEKKSEIRIPDINFFYKKKNLSKILTLRKEQEIRNIIKLKNMYESVDVLFKELNIKLVLTNIAKGIDGYYVEKSKENNIPSVCIPHGSVSEYFDKFDKIYKEIIAEPQFTKHSKFFAMQSKITRDYIRSYNINHNCIETGNLIFGDGQNNRKNKNKILFATTLKDFQNIQYLGVEMYYEFLENLKLLNSISKNNDLKFLVKPHPCANSCIEDFKKIYNNLEFTKNKIDKILKDVFVTVSFSSTVIEDSLYSNVPVILYDRWNRFKHCKAEQNYKKKNCAIYYVNDEDALINCINTIKESDNISFGDYIFKGATKSNMNNLLNKMLKEVL